MINEQLLEVTFTDTDGNDPLTFEGLRIVAKGNRTGSYITNSANVTITNLSKEDRDRLTTKYRPVDNLKHAGTRGWVYIDAGRKEDVYGEGAEKFRVFEGGVIAITQGSPPDIDVTFEIVSNFKQMSEIDSLFFGNNIRLSDLTRRVAEKLGLAYNYVGDADPTLATMSYSGALWGLVEKLDSIAGYSAIVDNGMLTVYPTDGVGSNKERPILINKDTGMVGTPQATNDGISVTILAKGDVKVGSRITTRSELSPSTDGTWKIIAIKFDLANRDNPFFYHCNAVSELL